MKGLAIKDVAERTGIAAGTIRMWEQRYGFPEPERTTAGYRALRRGRRRGAAARARLPRARALGPRRGRARARRRHRAPTGRRSSARSSRGEQPSRSQLLAQARRCSRISRAIEDETMARAAAPVVFGAFQRERNYRAVEHRYRAMARTADAVVVFADFERLRRAAGAPVEVPLEAGDALGNEWAVVIDAPGLRRVPARRGSSPRRRSAVPDRERTLRGALDARPADGAPRRAGRRRARAPRRRRARRADRGRCWPSGRWRWSSRRRALTARDEPDRRLPRRGRASEPTRTAPMRSVCVKPSCCAAASVRSQRASAPNGPRSTTGTHERPRPVVHGDVRPAREAAVGDADERRASARSRTRSCCRRSRGRTRWRSAGR